MTLCFFQSAFSQAAESWFFCFFPQCSSAQGIIAQGLLYGDKLNTDSVQLQLKMAIIPLEGSDLSYSRCTTFSLYLENWQLNPCNSFIGIKNSVYPRCVWKVTIIKFVDVKVVTGSCWDCLSRYTGIRERKEKESKNTSDRGRPVKSPGKLI